VGWSVVGSDGTAADFFDDRAEALARARELNAAAGPQEE
jgi:hypothetical protein